METKKMFMVEGIAGVWHYHLSETGKNGQPALCGETKVMQTLVPVNTWGMRCHLHEKYCKECERKAPTGTLPPTQKKE